jgi:sigma-B regulation protein RsbU (phosphoserine phosphatase)
MANRVSLRSAGRFLFAAILALVSLALNTSSSQAQTFDASHLPGPQDLATTWLVHAGDDPAYAETGFDDSSWKLFNTATSLKNVITGSQPTVVWYRLHVKVDPSQRDLALLEWNLESAFEVYVNGERILQVGRVDPFVPYSFQARLVRRVPDQQIATGHLVIAVRAHITTLEWSGTAPGLYATNLTIGQESTLREHAWLLVIGENLFRWLAWFSGLGLGVVAVALFAAQRSQKEYLWIFLQYACMAITAPFACYKLFHALPAAWDLPANGFELLGLFFYFLIFLAILKLRFHGWMRIVMALAIAAVAFSFAVQVRGSVSGLALLLAQAPIFILFACVLPVLLVIHWRRGNAEAGILLIPAIFQSLVVYVEILFAVLFRLPGLGDVAIRASGFVNHFQVGPIVLDWGSISQLFNVLSLAVIIIVRSTRISRQQALLEGEVAAAQHVQHVILPQHAEPVPGFIVESIYKPAQEVGGDFFQVVPDKTDNSLLIVAGDVSGKGLKAGMLVAMLVGAIRSTAETTKDPLAMLQALNRRLLGQDDAQATCLALRIQTDGTAVLANAGHLPPYLNGEPLPVEGALPLGVVNSAAFSVSHFKLNESDRLVLISDGIAEAKDAKGDLFGFDRVLELVRTRQSAEQLASAVQNFGQEDDITVLSLIRQHAV